MRWWLGPRAIGRHATRSARPTIQVSDCLRMNWLGGRDLNPDNVVQRAVNIGLCALVPSVSLRFSHPSLLCAPVRSGLFLCRVSHPVSGRAEIRRSAARGSTSRVVNRMPPRKSNPNRELPPQVLLSRSLAVLVACVMAAVVAAPAAGQGGTAHVSLPATAPSASCSLFHQRCSTGRRLPAWDRFGGLRV